MLHKKGAEPFRDAIFQVDASMARTDNQNLKFQSGRVRTGTAGRTQGRMQFV